MEPLPIFFIHNGAHFYLKCALIQARHFNPESTIYVLGDEKAAGLVQSLDKKLNIEFALLQNYKELKFGRGGVDIRVFPVFISTTLLIVMNMSYFESVGSY